MGLLLHARSGLLLPLRPRALVGRAPGCPVQLEDRRASAEHAVIAWHGGGWEARDLGSLNGTFVDGQRVTSGERVPLRRDSRLGFGVADDVWILADDGPAGPAALDLATDELICSSSGLLALPHRERPGATVFRGEGGGWRVEHAGGGVAEVHDREQLVVDGSRFCLFLPAELDALPGTLRTGGGPAKIADLSLDFRVSTDEEQVDIGVRVAHGEALGLPPRSGHYALLTLARARLADAARGLPADEQGWLYASELADMLGYTAERVNVEIFRARALLGRLGVVDAARLVERRASSRQLRLGVARLTVTRAGVEPSP